MKLTLFEQIQYRQLKKMFAFWLLIIAVPYAAVCTPIYHMINSNVLLSGSLPSLLLDFLMDLLNQLFYWGAFAVLIYTACRHGIEQCNWFVGIYSAIVLFRYIANLLAGYIMVGFPKLSDFFKNDFGSLVFDTVLDILLLGIVFWILRSMLSKSKGRGEPLMQSVFPLKRIFTIGNPVQKSVFFAAVLPAAVRVLSRIIFDLFYGAPTDLLDLLWMTTYYLLDLLGIVIGIIVITMILNRIYFKEMIAKAEDQSIFSE